MVQIKNNNIFKFSRGNRKMKGEFEMKKILMIISMALMMLSVGVTTFAANGSFASSPSANRAPTLVEFENASEDCTATIVIYAYADRDSLDAETKAKLEAAYASVSSAKDLGKLGYSVKALANSLDLTTDQLYVSDLFDISCENCENHDKHESFTITVSPSSVVNYAGFLHYDNGEWKLLESTVTKDGKITFTVDDFSPFAIVVHDGSVVDVPEKDPDMVLKVLAAAIVGFSLIGVAIIAGKISKN